MPAYLVERELPGLSHRGLLALRQVLREASQRLTASGSPVHYLGSTFLPACSRCFCRFEAPSLDPVKAVSETAQVPFLAIHEAIELPADGGPWRRNQALVNETSLRAPR